MHGVGTRRRALLLIVGLGAAVGGLMPMSALAQDPRISEAQRLAREWLALSDAGKTQASYDAASAKFKAAMTPQQWAQAAQSARAPYGTLVSRTLIGSQADLQMPNVPNGTYVMLMYRTTFANKDAAETITMEREPDGVWRLLGYSIR